MIDRNENRPGYKKTKVGWIPEEWDDSHVGIVCRINNELRYPLAKEVRNNIQGLYPYYGPTGILDYIDQYRIDGTYALIAEDGDHFLKFSKKPMTLLVSGKFNVNNHAHLIQGTDICLTEWFYVFFLHRNICRYTTRQGAGRYKLNKDDLKRLPIILPPIPEQKKIAEILSTWDKAIEQTRKLIDAKKRLKKGLMQQLLMGKNRLQEFNEPWKEYSLGELFDERIELNNAHLPLLAITGSSGVIPASKIKRKDSSAIDKSRYKRIVPGDVGYNTMRMWQGVSAISSMDGIVSPAYTICIPKDNIDSQFIGYYFKSPPVIYLFWRYSQGLVSDTLNLKFHNFSQIRVNLPSIKEQQKIAEILYAVDLKIDSINNKLAALEKQKRGLMQKLLSGEIRVKT